MTLALTCASAGFSRMTPEQVSAVVPAPLRDVPLLQYRFGICANTYRPALQALRDAEPDFADADYPLARYAMQGRHRRAIAESGGRRVEALEGIGRLERYLTSNPPR